MALAHCLRTTLGWRDSRLADIGWPSRSQSDRSPAKPDRVISVAFASDRRVDPFLDLRLGQRPHLGRGDLALREDHQRWYPAHPVLCRRLRIFVDVDLSDRKLAAILIGELFERGRD